MSDLLASYADFQTYIKDGKTISSNSEKGAAIVGLLARTSRRMETYILKSSVYSLGQYTSDGISGPTEFYGVEHYGLHKRNLIRLARPFNLVSVTSIIDGDTTLTTDYFNVDYRTGTIYRTTGRFKCYQLAVQVIYTAGWAVIGSGDTLKIGVPDDLTDACLKQSAYEFSVREPGGVPVGASTISRPDGSIVVQPKNWLPDVLDAMKQYRR